MIHTTAPTSEEQRLQALREARQRIVELQAVRTYLLESNSPAALLSDVDALVAQALAREQSLIALGKATPKSSRRRLSRVMTAVFVLATWADDSVLALLDIAWSASLAV